MSIVRSAFKRMGIMVATVAVAVVVVMLSACPSAGAGSGGGGTISLGAFTGPMVVIEDLESGHYIFVLANGYDGFDPYMVPQSEEPSSALVVFMRLSGAWSGSYEFVSYDGDEDGILSVFAYKDVLISSAELENQTIDGRFFVGGFDSGFTSGGTVTIGLIEEMMMDEMMDEMRISFAYNLELDEVDYTTEQIIEGPFQFSGSYDGEYDYIEYQVGE